VLGPRLSVSQHPCFSLHLVRREVDGVQDAETTADMVLPPRLVAPGDLRERQRGRLPPQGLGAAGLNGTETAVSSETSAPAGVSFSTPSALASGLSLGDLPAGQHFAVWVRRTVTTGAAATSDSFTLRVQGDTNP